jgi:glycine cleavage system H protein
MRFTKEHEWVEVKDGVATIGITAYAAEQLGDVVFVETPEVGKHVKTGDNLAVVESVKAASDVYAPVSGEVVESNTALSDQPEQVGESPEGAGWFAKVKLADPAEVDTLMDKAAYESFHPLLPAFAGMSGTERDLAGARSEGIIASFRRPAMSDKPLAERLQLKGTRRLALIDAPDGLNAVIGAADRRAGLAEAEVVVLFAADRAALDAALPNLLHTARADAIVWIAYPKLTSPLAGDLNRDIIHDLTPAFGLDTVSQIAVDADWSAMRMKRVG